MTPPPPPPPPPTGAVSGSGDEIVRRKRELRVRMKALRAALSAEDRRRWSLAAAEALMASRLWGEARAVGLFHSMGHEIDTEPLVRALWRAGRPVALPVAPPLGQALVFRWVTEDTELVPSRYGALEPGAEAAVAELSSSDLLVVPGLAFDARGARLGYGGGYYDRTLATTDAGAALLCFACQQVDRVPEEPHDRRVHGVVTERGWAVGS